MTATASRANLHPAALDLATETATEALGRRLGAALQPGDVVFLFGDLGAGKSTLARAAIQNRAGHDVTVPSPTFTLTQEYEAGNLRIIHADLYRLDDPEEMHEIGLLEATDAACLIEWPEKLAAAEFPERLEIHLAMSGEGRRATFQGFGQRGAQLSDALSRDRDTLRTAFLDAHASQCACTAIPGDASKRRYFRIGTPRSNAILMDAPFEAGEDVRPFIHVTERLRARDLSAPALLASDQTHGFLLLEDLGDNIFARLCMQEPALEPNLYAAAVDLLTELVAQPEDALPSYNDTVLLREAALLVDWWLPACGIPPSADLRAEYLNLMRAALSPIEPDRSTLVLRDYHAENLIWLPDRSGAARVGLLDYQDALIGHPSYDLVSLLEDARRDVAPELAQAMHARFLSARPPGDHDALRYGYDALGAQRNAKIIGIFARLCLRDGKPRYLDLIPRVWAHLIRDVSRTELSALLDFLARHVPAPEPDLLSRIAAQAGTHGAA